MHPRTREILDYLDTRRAELKHAIESMPPELQAARPERDRWSAAEIVDHLATVEERLGQLVARELAAARARGLGADADTSPVIPTIDAGRFENRSRRITAGAAVQPRDGVDAVSAFERLEQVRAATRALVTDADGLALGEVVIPHPVFGSLNLYGWLLFIAGHEARHTAQIREIAQHSSVDGRVQS